MEKQKKVLLGMSGGVDSSVAAMLLQKQGYEVIGLFMINYSNNKNKFTGECNWTEDKRDAEKIASKLNIPLITINAEKEYEKKVINEMLKDYKLGVTPNPDSECNKEIKFPILFEYATKLKADFIATGHYASVKKIRNHYFLSQPRDKNKDQTYFLYNLKEQELKKILFPISNYTKQQIREIAKRNNFSNYEKESSKGICFIGKINTKEFLKRKIKSMPGNVLNESNEIVGKHEGSFLYTIGERVGEAKGVSLKNSLYGKKLYVLEKDTKNNTITIGEKDSPLLLKNEFTIKKMHWINKKHPLKNTKVRIRHLGELIPANLKKSKGKLICHLKRRIPAIAAGQSAVVYSKNLVLGGGEISFS